MVRVGNNKYVTLTDKQIRKMVEYFGGEEKLPDPTIYPKSFKYYVDMYLFLKKIKKNVN